MAAASLAQLHASQVQVAATWEVCQEPGVSKKLSMSRAVRATIRPGFVCAEVRRRSRLSAEAAFRDTASIGSAPHPFQPKPPLPDSTEAPLIELEFVAPDNRPGETDPIPEPQYCTAVSGQKLLRDFMLENELELYGPYGKMMNCEGRGMCGTCLVDILEGAELMNKRTPAEPYYLKLRPDSWRLACQATLGDGINGGKIKVKRRPQKGHPLM